MQTALKRIRGAIGMGVLWALAWAPVAVIIGTTIIDPDDSMDEPWVMVGVIPGFISGVLFSIVLGMAARHRKLDDLSVGRFARWGAVAGFATSLLPFLLGDRGGEPMFKLAAVVISSFTVMSAASAAGSLAMVRWGERRALRGGERVPLVSGGDTR